MGAWRRCEQCRKVLAEQEFDEPAATCRTCLTRPTPAVRAARAAGVTTIRTRPVVATTEPTSRRPLVGVAGSGDLEARERRARRSALVALAELHAEDFEQLLQTARRGEGLRA